MAVLRVARPGRRNAIDGDTAATMTAFLGAQPLDYRYATEGYRRLFQALREVETPVVSAVNGTVAGAGWMLASSPQRDRPAERHGHLDDPARVGRREPCGGRGRGPAHRDGSGPAPRRGPDPLPRPDQAPLPPVAGRRHGHVVRGGAGGDGADRHDCRPAGGDAVLRRGSAGEVHRRFRLAAHGALVAFHGRRLDKLEEAVEQAGSGFAVAADISAPDAGQAVVAQPVERLGGIDVLVYAASMSRLSLAQDTSAAEWANVCTPATDRSAWYAVAWATQNPAADARSTPSGTGTSASAGTTAYSAKAPAMTVPKT